jgi:transcriptional regulator with XRE-family HTH domain
MSGKELKAKRKKLCLSIEVHAALSGVDGGSISRYESGKRIPSAAIIAKMEKTLDDVARVRAGFTDVALDMGDVHWLRKKIAKLDRGAPHP